MIGKKGNKARHLFLCPDGRGLLVNEAQKERELWMCSAH